MEVVRKRRKPTPEEGMRPTLIVDYSPAAADEKVLKPDKGVSEKG